MRSNTADAEGVQDSDSSDSDNSYNPDEDKNDNDFESDNDEDVAEDEPLEEKRAALDSLPKCEPAVIIKLGSVTAWGLVEGEVH